MYVESERGWWGLGEVFEYIHFVWNLHNVCIEIVPSIDKSTYKK
jgi:hypothetical protein